MRTKLYLLALSGVFFLGSAFVTLTDQPFTLEQLRQLYSQPTSQWPKPDVDPDIKNFQELGVRPDPKFPKDNPYSEKKAELGKFLFFDPRLSVSGQIACASCHEPQLGWGDGKQVSLGHDRQPGKRNAMTLLNVWNNEHLFWDGRANSLEHQVRFPVQDRVEMNHELAQMEKNLNKIKGYQVLFKEAFGKEKFTIQEIAQALTTFERTIVSRKSRFDRFLEGKKNELTDLEIKGLHLFRTKARCINCHNGPLFTDNQFHNVGLTYYGRKYEDLGRYHVTKRAEDVGKFRTPSLRDVVYTAPYFHNGLFPTLDGTLNMYNMGMPNLKPTTQAQKADTLFPKTSSHLKPLGLSEDEKQAVIAFLGAISSVQQRINQPELPQ
ncbi:cytochrome-c peroxidase [Rufibacter immobilis]|uniref:cytochrome-c peroxidase n=1 Tax=Rufibacter immobilis TaxID=1348778 RepID=UPI0035ED56BE